MTFYFFLFVYFSITKNFEVFVAYRNDEKPAAAATRQLLFFLSFFPKHFSFFLFVYFYITKNFEAFVAYRNHDEDLTCLSNDFALYSSNELRVHWLIFEALKKFDPVFYNR